MPDLTSLSPRRIEPAWRHLSTATGDLPLPGPAPDQTALLVGDFDRGGKNGFVVGFRRGASPALVWYRPTGTGWSRHVIEPDGLSVEAGGAAFDIDGDGDLDIVFGGDSSSDELWWWENPYPNFAPDARWKRRLIKKGGATQQHDQIFGDFLGTGKPQLVFWNQRAKTLFLAEIPPDPRGTEPWPYTAIYSGSAGEEGRKTTMVYAEGLAAHDIDGDGKVELLAGNLWFKHRGGMNFEPIPIGPIGGRIAVGQLKPGSHPQVVIAPGDGTGPLRWYECVGNPEKTADWVGHDLLDRDMVHGHSLAIADIDGDGHLDIFAAEMGHWGQWQKGVALDHPGATAWILYGDGAGHFRRTVFQHGMDFHEARVADMDGDGRMDIVGKPFRWEVPRLDVWIQAPPLDPRKVIPPAAEVGLQIYSFRTELAADLVGTLTKIRQMGFTRIEVPGLYGRSAEELRLVLDQAGLKCESMVAKYDALRDRLDQVVAEAKALGASYVVNPQIPHEGILTEAATDAAAMAFDAWGARLRAAGLQFCYHIHGFEFAPAPAPDSTQFDRLMRRTDAGNVQVELDVFWVIHGGQDPVALLRQYPGRFPLIHLKDMKKGVRGDLSGKADKAWSVALGQGQVDWNSLFQAADQAGVRAYYIEDEAPEAMRQVPESLRYLAGCAEGIGR